MKIVILIYAFCNNRGSEALVTGTVSILKKHIPESEIVLCSAERYFSPDITLEGVDRYIHRYDYYGGFSLKRLKALFYSRILKNEDKADRVRLCGLIRECSDADLVIVSAGDNYDKTYDAYHIMHSANKLIREKTKGKMILYDCSLAKEDIDQKVVDDFKLFDAITAREHETLGYLKEVLPNQNIFYYPDPAFVMQPEEVTLPDILKKTKVVGVNVSSMVTDTIYGSNEKKVLATYKKMVDWILKNTDLGILLIPHVMEGKDLTVLRKLYEPFANSDRVTLLDNEKLRARQLKWIISQCYMYVGARTHSTIAAYSSHIPTLVFGYSIKSRGIAKDLFGTDEGYVVKVNEADEDSLMNAFIKLYYNKEQEKQHLDSTMPDYIKETWKTGELFCKLLESR